MRVYRCEVTTVLYVLAESHQEACDLAESNAGEEPSPDVDAHEVDSPERTGGWALSSLVYHSGTEDITLAEAFKLATEPVKCGTCGTCGGEGVDWRDHTKMPAPICPDCQEPTNDR